MNRIEKNVDGSFAVLGKLDSSIAEELGSALDRELDNGQNDIQLDLSKVEYLSSFGLREMIRIHKRMTRNIANSKGLIIINPSEQVEQVLYLAGLDTIFEVAYRK